MNLFTLVHYTYFSNIIVCMCSYVAMHVFPVIMCRCLSVCLLSLGKNLIRQEDQNHCFNCMAVIFLPYKLCHRKYSNRTITSLMYVLHHTDILFALVLKINYRENKIIQRQARAYIHLCLETLLLLLLLERDGRFSSGRYR